jgi:hypothetical protein
MTTVRRWDPALGPLQLSTLRAALEREGLATAWWSEVPGTSVAQHEHPFPEARWVLDGFLRVHIGSEVVELGPGDRLGGSHARSETDRRGGVGSPPLNRLIPESRPP